MKSRLPHTAAILSLLTGLPTAVAQQAAPASEDPTLRKLDDRNRAELERSLEVVSEIARQQEAAERERRRLEAIERRAGIAAPETSSTPSATPPANAPAAPSADAGRDGSQTPSASRTGGSTPAGRASAAPPPRGTPVTFDKITPPPVYDPVVRRRPVVESGALQAAMTIAPPQNDPRNPGRPLDKSDPLARTYHSRGGVEVTTPTFWLSSDELDYRLAVDAEDDGGNPSTKGKQPKGRAIDPVTPGAGEEDKPPFEWAEARGRARVRRIANGKLEEGFGALIRYDQKTGNIFLTGFPEVILGNRRIIGKSKDSKIILKPNGEEPWLQDCRVSILDRGDKPKPAPASPVPQNSPETSSAPAPQAGGNDSPPGPAAPPAARSGAPASDSPARRPAPARPPARRTASASR